MWAPPHFRERNTAYMVSLREKRKARGDCQRCGRAMKRTTAVFLTCLRCRLKMQQYHARVARTRTPRESEGASR